MTELRCPGCDRVCACECGCRAHSHMRRCVACGEEVRVARDGAVEGSLSVTGVTGVTGPPQSVSDRSVPRPAGSVVECAGPLGIPAAVIHPDDALPQTWRIVSAWSHGGQDGAYVEWTGAPGSGRRSSEPLWGQVVYSTDAKRYGTSHIGARISAGADALICPSVVGRNHYRPTPVELERIAYYAERGQSICRLDWIAQGQYEANGSPQAGASFAGMTPTLRWDELPPPSPDDDDDLTEFAELTGQPAPPTSLHPDSEWPAEWQRMTQSGTEWAYKEPAWWMPIRFSTDAKVYTARGLRASLNSYRSRMHSAVYDAQRGTTASSPARAVPAPPQPSAGPPPAPGPDRVKWIGQQVTAMMPHTVAGYSPLQRRRQAARQALALSAGYEPESAANDSGTLAGSLLLHLMGLNEFARRELGEDTDDALL